VCNLKALCVNILEPLKAKYPGLIVTSGFRNNNTVSDGVSQHCKGQAADLQWPSLTNAQYMPIAQWIRDNMPIDQLILEHSSASKKLWIHVSYNRQASKQRGEIKTMIAGKYYPGLKIYY
jgi:hypothetical protein